MSDEREMVPADVLRLQSRCVTASARIFGALAAERDRYREALARIADGDVEGVGDYSECVQLFAVATLEEGASGQQAAWEPPELTGWPDIGGYGGES